MKNTVAEYLITLFYFLAIDFTWLSIMSKKVYAPQIGHLMAEKPQLLPAFIFYLLFVVGLLVFVILPSISQNFSIGKTLLYAALFGLVTYATYDLTNLATLKNWPIVVTIIDMIWGATLSALVTLLSILTFRKIG